MRAQPGHTACRKHADLPRICAGSQERFRHKKCNMPRNKSDRKLEKSKKSWMRRKKVWRVTRKGARNVQSNAHTSGMRARTRRALHTEETPKLKPSCSVNIKLNLHSLKHSVNYKNVNWWNKNRFTAKIGWFYFVHKTLQTESTLFCTNSVAEFFHWLFQISFGLKTCYYRWLIFFVSHERNTIFSDQLWFEISKLGQNKLGLSWADGL